MAKNILSLQLLRNTTAFESKNLAVDGIKNAATNDGTIKLARYIDGDKIKTIFGIYNEDMASKGSGYTIYDGDSKVISDIIGRLDAIDGGSSASGIIDTKIASAISALDSTGFTGDGNQVVTAVTEDNGIVTATGANVGTLKLAGYTEGSESGHVASDDSLNQALAKLQNQIDAVNDGVNGLNYTDTAVAGSYVSEVDQVNGKISVTRAELPTVAAISEAGKPITAVSESLGTISATAGTINAEFVNIADSAENFTASTVEAALAEVVDKYVAADTALKAEILGGASTSADTLGELETLINNLSSNAATYTIRKDTADLPATVKERYTLVETKNGSSTDKQVSIDIAKDSHIVSINYITTGEHAQNLEYVYIDASGNTQTTYVDMSELVLEAEFASGVTVTNHVAHGVVDPASETFLTVGADGFKLSGVQDAINAASGNVQSAIDAVSGNVNTLSAKTVTAVEMTGGTAAIADNAADGTKKITINTDGSQILATGYAKGTNSDPIAASDSINAALAKLENQIDAAKAAATTKVVEGTDAGNNLEISSATSADGSVTYTINLTDVASASALTDEIAHRKAVDGVNGDAYTADTNAHYINSASSLFGADQALDSAINTVSGKVETISGDVETLEDRVDEISAVTSALTTGEIDAIENAVGLTNAGGHQQTSGNYTSAATTIAGEIAALDTQVKTNTDDIAALSGKSLTGITVNGSGLTVTNNVAAVTVQGKQTEATPTGNEAIVVETDEHGNLTLGLGNVDAGTY